MKINISNILINVAYYYMLITTIIMNFIRKIKSHIIAVNKITIFNNNKKHNIYFQYILLNLLIKIKCFINSMQYCLKIKEFILSQIESLKNFFDIKCEVAEIEIFSPNNSRNIIFENISLTNII